MKKQNAYSIISFLAGAMAVAMFFMMASELANATGNKHDDVDIDVQNTDTVSQHQGQEQSQHQDQSQNQTQDQANSQSINFTSPNDITVRRTNAAWSPSIDPSHPCALTVSGGLSLPGGSGSFGKAYIDPECNARETSRLFFQFGERDKAIMILCNQPSAESLPGCKPYQDYNKELKLMTTGHDQLVKENTELRERIDTLLAEREHDRKRCDEEKQRQFDSCINSK